MGTHKSVCKTSDERPGGIELLDTKKTGILFLEQIFDSKLFQPLNFFWWNSPICASTQLFISAIAKCPIRLIRFEKYQFYRLQLGAHHVVILLFDVNANGMAVKALGHHIGCA